jgi:polyhydroxyalkanoate synthesis regulator phasin
VPLGNHNTSRSSNRRIDSLARERDSIMRILSQAEMDRVREEVEVLKKKLSSIEERLSGD